ncbi:MAG TPA: HPP family protein [Dyella sp.]|uniref:HPP family protein n=1 Tax=Dyella sp. TaxID=1869338 RepID=UPI002F952A79
MSIECIHDAKRNFCLYWIAAALFIGIAAIGFVPSLVLGKHPGTAPLLAPMGASALLMLTMPKSSLARPRTVLIANAVATAIGLLTPHLISSMVFASAMAMAIAVTAMGMLRTVHPPSAGLTLFAVSRGTQPLSQSLDFLTSEVMLATVLLVVSVFIVASGTPGHSASSTLWHSTLDPGVRRDDEQERIFRGSL